jgi:hypothetical protein
VSAPAPVVSAGAAAAAPGGALHFGMGLRARYAGPARSRPAALAGLPFATLGRRMAPSPLAAPRPAAAGFAWRALGAAPLREEAAPVVPHPWRGALGQAPAEAQLDAGQFNAPLPELLPAESALVGRDPGAPFHPLPQAPARPAPAAPAAHGGSRTGGESAVGGGSGDGGSGIGDGGSADGDGMIDGGSDARAVPVFPGLPERLVPAWAMGGGEGPAGSAGSHLPRVPSPLPPGTSLADLAAPAQSGGGMADGALPLPTRAPQLPMAADGSGDAADRPGDGSSAQAPWGGADGGMDDAPPLTWASPAAAGDASGGGAAAADAGRGARDGGWAAAQAESRAFADAVGFTPLSWPAPGGGEPDTTAQLPRLAWAETGGGASAAVAPPPGETLTGGEPGPYAPTLLHGITLAAQSLATAVERHETVREARREAQEAARPAAPAPPPAPAVDPTSDEVVRTLMRKMTAMAREERFRAGGLR